MSLMTIEAETRDLLAALERLGPAVDVRLRAEARYTAGQIRDEAQRRIRRRTGRTAAQITAEESYDGTGYVVYVKTDEPDVPANLDLWLEHGTRFMTARPFLQPSALLEAGSHRRRVLRACEDEIRRLGLA